jgi:hypothetical protein
VTSRTLLFPSLLRAGIKLDRAVKARSLFFFTRDKVLCIKNQLYRVKLLCSNSQVLSAEIESERF